MKYPDQIIPDELNERVNNILDSDNSLRRCDVIGDLLVKEYGYKLTSHWYEYNIGYWKYDKIITINKNKNLKDNYQFNGFPTIEDTERYWNKIVLPEFIEEVKEFKSEKANKDMADSYQISNLPTEYETAKHWRNVVIPMFSVRK